MLLDAYSKFPAVGSVFEIANLIAAHVIRFLLTLGEDFLGHNKIYTGTPPPDRRRFLRPNASVLVSIRTRDGCALFDITDSDRWEKMIRCRKKTFFELNEEEKKNWRGRWCLQILRRHFKMLLITNYLEKSKVLFFEILIPWIYLKLI